MLSVLSILSFYMVDSSLSIRLDAIDEGGPWEYGDVRWFAPSRTFPNHHLPFLEHEPENDCRTKMKPKTNWRTEEHEDTQRGGMYYNFPRYYIKNRVASDHVRNHYIASRNPIIRGLDDVRGDPDPIDANDDPDKFKDFQGIIQIADVFCQDSTMGRVRLGTSSKSKLVEECGIIEKLVSLCMSDPKITPGRNKNKPLIAATFDAPVPSINEEKRDEARTLVESKCAKFFRIEVISKQGVNAITNREQWSRKWGRYLKGAWIAGYRKALVLDGHLIDHKFNWNIYNIDTLLLGIAGGMTHDVWEILPNKLGAANGKEYWYFCCENDVDRC